MSICDIASEIEISRELSKNKFSKVYQERPYQIRLMDKVIADWRGDNEHNAKVNYSLIESPPGSGKTVMGFKLAKILKEQVGDINGIDPNDFGIGWVAGRRNLLKQAENENNYLVNCPDVHYISQFTHNIDDCPLKKYKHKLLVIDEAHHEACDTIHSIINVLDPDYMIGLSATPRRTDRAKLCFQKSYRDAGFYSLIDEGWLSKFDHWMIPNWDAETVTRLYISEKEKWGKSIIYFLNREECHKAMSYLQDAGINADLVTGETDRESQLQRFENGELDVLVNMFVLTEGFDCPELKTVFVRDSGELPTTQMCLDQKTEILTKNGWKTNETILDDDQVAALNLGDDCIEWVPIEEKIVRQIGVNEQFIGAKNAHIDIRVTDQHNMVYKSSSKTSKDWQTAEANKLINKKQPFKIPVSGIMHSDGLNLTNQELQLVGLFLTDGCLLVSKDGKKTKAGYCYVTISQSIESDQIPLIEQIITDCGCPISRIITKRKGKLSKYADRVVYSISQKWLSESVLKIVDKNKIITIQKLDNITSDQLSELLVGMQIGDGKKRRNIDYIPRTYALCLGNNYEIIDAFQSLCVRKGYRCNLGYYQYKPNDWNKLGEHGAIVYVKRQSHSTITGASVVNSPIVENSSRCRLKVLDKSDDELVWCVRNHLGTIITRRNGKVAIVGNCGRVLRPHPDIPISNIVQSINTRWPFTKTANIAHRQHVWHNSGWKFIGKSDLIEKEILNTIHKLFKAEVDEDLLQKLRSMKRKRRIDI